MKKKSDAGFTLMDLMIVIVMIGIISAIAVPRLMKAKVTANEASAIATARIVNQAETTSKGNNSGFKTLTELSESGLIDDSIASGSKSGYLYSITPDNSTIPASYIFSAIPVSGEGIMQTGSRRFGIDGSGVIMTDLENLTVNFTNTADLQCSTCKPLGN